MNQYNFAIIIEEDENGFFASCPELQGCYSQGDTYEEAILNIKDAIKLHVEDMVENHEDISIPKSVSFSNISITL